MQTYAVQLDIVWEDKAANHSKVRTLLGRARPARGSLVVLPEMFATGFSMNVATVTDSASRADHRFLEETARDLGVYLVGGLVTTGTDGRGRNEAVVVSPAGEVAARYCKLHPFAPGKEAQHYTAGCEITSFAWGEFNVCPFVCYDLRFPEIFRAGVRRGANLFTVIANWPVAREEHWVTLLRARAIENQAYVMGVNRCGKDPWLAYPGRSMVVAPSGEVLADGGREEGVVEATVDQASLVAYREQLPFLRDMRTDFVRGA